MPSLNLGEGEATAIAMYLLRAQAHGPDPSAPRQKIRGLTYEYFEGNFSDTTKLEASKAKGSGFVDKFTLTPRQRADNIGFRFTGFVSVATDGDYTFYASSDDGSRLYLGSELVVDYFCTHATTVINGSIKLNAGVHRILVTWFKGGG